MKAACEVEKERIGKVQGELEDAEEEGIIV